MLQGKFLRNWGFIILDLSIAGYFLAQAVAGTLLNGFDELTCPLCIPGSLHYAAFPGSLFVFASFLLVMTLKVSPKNAAAAALFAVGTFDMIASSTSFIWGAPYYFQGYSGPNLAIWLIMITTPVLYWRIVPSTRAICAMFIAFLAILLVQMTFGLLNAGWTGTLTTYDWKPPLWWQWRIENVEEIMFCYVAYLWFKPRSAASLARV